MPEYNYPTGAENKAKDELDVKYISTKLGLQEIKIVTCFRLGKKQANKTRPLKVILAEKAQRKFMLENAKFIPTKLPPEWKNVIVSKDLTPVQREERKKFISNKKDTIQTKKNPGQNADHQNALVVNDTNTRRFSFRTRRVATSRPEKTNNLEKNTHLQTTVLDTSNNTSPKAAMETESIQISPISGNLSNINVLKTRHKIPRSCRKTPSTMRQHCRRMTQPLLEELRLCYMTSRFLQPWTARIHVLTL